MIRQDFHIHTRLSSCSGDPRQTPENIRTKAEELSLEQICLTDHFWDATIPGASDWYKPQNLEHIRKALSDLPRTNSDTTIFFGCETEYAGGNRIGISRQVAMELDFVLIPISHFHMTGFVRPAGVNSAEEVANLWISRYRELLELDLPWDRVGLAHVLDCCIGDLETEFLEHIMRKPVGELFTETAARGTTVEINGGSLFDGRAAAMNREMYMLMRECGCRFTLGSDAHQLDRMNKINDSLDFAMEIGLEDGDLRILS